MKGGEMNNTKDRTCVIRFRDGRSMTFKGADVPSTKALLILFRKRRVELKRRDLLRRLKQLRS